MAQFQIKAGGTLDLLTKTEVRDVLKDWSHELVRGARFLRRSVTGTVDASGNLLMGGGIGGDDSVGPNDGFVWAVTRVSVAAGLTANQSVSLYANDANPSSLLLPAVSRVEYPGDHGCVLVSGDELIIAGSGLTVGAIVVVSIGVKEAPQLMAWSL